METDEVERRLFAAFEARAKARKYKVGPDATSDVRNKAQAAAARVQKRVAEGRVTEKELLATAEAAFKALAEAMIASAQNIEGYAFQNPGILGERTLERAMLRLCPLWPLC